MTTNSSEQKTRILDKSQLIIICASLYWASILLGNFGLGTSSSTILQTENWGSSAIAAVYDASFCFFYLPLLLTMVLALVFADRFCKQSAQKLLAWISVGGASVSLLGAMPPFSSSQICVIAAFVARGIGESCYIMLWGLCFTSLSKKDAERVTLSSLALAFVIYLILAMLIHEESITNSITNIMVIVSLIPFLANRFTIDIVCRPDSDPNKQVLIPFYASRIFLGICLGAAMFLCTAVAEGTSQRAVVLSLIGVAILVLSLVDMRRKGATDLTFLRLAPLVACGAIICPYMNTDNLLVSLCGHAPAIVWACWIILHSVQISAIKEDSGIDDALLSLTEKLSFQATAVLTAVVLALVPQLSDALAANDQLVYASLGVLIFVVVVVCSYQLNRVIDGKEAERIVDSVQELNAKRNEPVYEQIAQRYDLTPRELDVFRLLAKGMARPTICEELCISEGTERTHVRHIYQKLDVHSRDELMALVEKETREQLAGQQGALPQDRRTG